MLNLLTMMQMMKEVLFVPLLCAFGLKSPGKLMG